MFSFLFTTRSIFHAVFVFIIITSVVFCRVTLVAEFPCFFCVLCAFIRLVLYYQTVAGSEQSAAALNPIRSDGLHCDYSIYLYAL